MKSRIMRICSLSALPAAACALLAACHFTRTVSIEFTEVPEAGKGGKARIEEIAGRVAGARKGERIVLFAKAGTWWVQPSSTEPFTAVQADSAWRASIHLGTEYAALLVAPDYLPPFKSPMLPSKGGGVIAIATVAGSTPKIPEPPPKRIQFSGYEWEVEQSPTEGGGTPHENRASNAWVDGNGWLHLRIAREGDQWACAEVALLRSLGYGSYSFALRDTPKLEPGDVLGLFTWDTEEAGQNHREIDIEMSQWGDPSNKNEQFVIQPYYVPANVFRFEAPTGSLTHSFRWQAGRVSLSVARRAAPVIAEHTFTSGIPLPGGERVHLNLYVYGNSKTPQRNGVEVVIEKFEYLP